MLYMYMLLCMHNVSCYRAEYPKHIHNSRGGWGAINLTEHEGSKGGGGGEP